MAYMMARHLKGSSKVARLLVCASSAGFRPVPTIRFMIPTVVRHLPAGWPGPTPFESSDSLSRQVAYFEDSVGFVRLPAAAPPAWPGGRASSWAAPRDAPPDAATSTAVIVVAIVVSTLVCAAVVAAAVWWCAFRDSGEDSAERRLRLKVAELRAELGVSRADGYLMGGERAPVWWGLVGRSARGLLSRGQVNCWTKRAG
jgi:hypothetical protein